MIEVGQIWQVTCESSQNNVYCFGMQGGRPHQLPAGMKFIIKAATNDNWYEIIVPGLGAAESHHDDIEEFCKLVPE